MCHNRPMDHHTVAAVSITGTCFDVLGSLYLAYDLLGGQHGPLRLLTRAVTYSLVFGIGYGLGLGLFFGLASGIATGITLSIEFNRAARGLDHYSLSWEALFSAIRGFGFGVGLYRIVGFRFAIAFAILITVGQAIRLLSRHASCYGLCSISPSTAYPASVLGNCGPHCRLHSHCPCLQLFYPSPRPSMVFRDSRRASDRRCHRCWSNHQSLHRILR